MAFKIGFTTVHSEDKPAEVVSPLPEQMSVPRKSVVRVYFDSRNMTLSYYNDLFDLHRGDIVYVDGKLEGQRGRVLDVNYNFKIKVADYKRVIAVADTSVSGQFFIAGSYFVTFDRFALPAGKAVSWYKAPDAGFPEYVFGNDGTAFPLNDLRGMNVSPEVAGRGHNYYIDTKVRYICVDGTKGYAIIMGSQPYEVEFDYENSEISGLTCSCYCANYCKHEIATMLQLRETLALIETFYSEQYEQTGYFAAISKGDLFSCAIDGRESGCFTL